MWNFNLYKLHILWHIYGILWHTIYGTILNVWIDTIEHLTAFEDLQNILQLSRDWFFRIMFRHRASPPLWQPENGTSRNDWMSHHGMSAEEYTRTQDKLKQLKTMLSQKFGPGIQVNNNSLLICFNTSINICFITFLNIWLPNYCYDPSASLPLLMSVLSSASLPFLLLSPTWSTLYLLCKWANVRIECRSLGRNVYRKETVRMSNVYNVHFNKASYNNGELNSIINRRLLLLPPSPTRPLILLYSTRIVTR